MADKSKDNAAAKAAKKNKGLLGGAARALGGRARQIDAAASWGDNSKKDVRRK